MKGDSFESLSEEDVRHATDKIMIRGAAICGCSLPVTEGFAETISNELAIFINEFGYGGMTLSEIFLALHMNASGNLRYPSGDTIERVEFTGHCFNVTFIAKVLNIYKFLRNSLDRKFENQIDGY